MQYDDLNREWRCVHSDCTSPTYHLRKKIIFNVIKKYIPCKSARALDVGCGTGEHALELASMGMNVTALDISKYAIEKARTDYAKSTMTEKVEFKVEDIGRFETDERYDFVLLSEVLEHLEDDIPVLKKYVNLLKDDGYILCTFPFDPRLWSEEDQHCKHVRRYDMDRVNVLLESSRLNVVEFFCYGFPFLRIAWTIQSKRTFFRKIVNKETKTKPALRFLLRSITKMIVFFDYFLLKTNSGVGIIFLAKKRVRS